MKDPIIERNIEDKATRAKIQKRRTKVKLIREVQEDYSLEQIDERLEKLEQDILDCNLAKRRTNQEIARLEEIKQRVMEKIK